MEFFRFEMICLEYGEVVFNNVHLSIAFLHLHRKLCMCVFVDRVSHRVPAYLQQQRLQLPSLCAEGAVRSLVMATGAWHKGSDGAAVQFYASLKNNKCVPAAINCSAPGGS